MYVLVDNHIQPITNTTFDLKASNIHLCSQNMKIKTANEIIIKCFIKFINIIQRKKLHNKHTISY